MKMRIKKPEENVEYTFRFPPKKKYTYRYYGDEQKGRLLLFNKTKGYYTGMTPQYFTFLIRNRLVEKKYVMSEEKPAPKDVITPTDTAPFTSEKLATEIKPLESELKDYIFEILKKLEKIPEIHRHYIRSRFTTDTAYYVENLITAFKSATENGISDKDFNVLMGRYLTTDATLSALRKGFDAVLN